jgi:hypothetical protein
MAKRKDTCGLSRDEMAHRRRIENEGLCARSLKANLRRLRFEPGQIVVCHEIGNRAAARWVGVVERQRAKTLQYIVRSRWLPDGRPLAKPVVCTFGVTGYHMGSPGGLQGYALEIGAMEASC